MPTQIETNASRILHFLYESARDEIVPAGQISQTVGLTPGEVNDAVSLLVEARLAEWIQALGTAPYDFVAASITARGRAEHQRAISQSHSQNEMTFVARPPTPVGSPYGFQDEDWEVVIERRMSPDTLFVCFGYQFTSQHYVTDVLVTSVKWMLDGAVIVYNRMPGRKPVSLTFTPLAAGYGEHLFNQIARDIISSDIAVFDTSDANPNVMLEMGVALTWGIRVLPIKEASCPKPPSDISGQTWANYTNSAADFEAEHQNKMVSMIDLALRKKLRSIDGV